VGAAAVALILLPLSASGGSVRVDPPHGAAGNRASTVPSESDRPAAARHEVFVTPGAVPARPPAPRRPHRHPAPAAVSASAAAVLAVPVTLAAASAFGLTVA
jgi:hypothetical protein